MDSLSKLLLSAVPVTKLRQVRREAAKRAEALADEANVLDDNIDALDERIAVLEAESGKAADEPADIDSDTEAEA